VTVSAAGDGKRNGKIAGLWRCTVPPGRLVRCFAGAGKRRKRKVKGEKRKERERKKGNGKKEKIDHLTF
jgi:hypothetical protein